LRRLLAFCYERTVVELESSGDLHGAEGPVPVRRTPKDQWPPLSKVLMRIKRPRPTKIRERARIAPL